MDELIIEALAVARITRLVQQDRVPVGWLRDRVKARAWKSHDASLAKSDEPYVVELLECPWCMSVWIALAVIVLRRVPGWPLLARALAASYVAGFLNERN